MKIYTLYYTDTKLYNKSVFVCPNDETAIKAMKLNLLDKTSPQTERFRNEVKLGNTELVALAYFEEEKGIHIEADDDDFDGNGGFVYVGYMEKICNLKELLDDNNGNMETSKQDNS